jgi:hypothetical protein
MNARNNLKQRNRANRNRFACAYRVREYGAEAQLVQHETNGQNRLAGTRFPEDDHPPCFLPSEIRADVSEHACSTTCGQLQSALVPKFKIINTHVGSAT